jgi:hypothetical protein
VAQQVASCMHTLWSMKRKKTQSGIAEQMQIPPERDPAPAPRPPCFRTEPRRKKLRPSHRESIQPRDQVGRREGMRLGGARTREHDLCGRSKPVKSRSAHETRVRAGRGGGDLFRSHQGGKFQWRCRGLTGAFRANRCRNRHACSAALQHVLVNCCFYHIG